jgi:hypothetical protein
MTEYEKTIPVCQLDEDNYFIGITIADLDPLEPSGRYLIPRGAVNAPEPKLKKGHVCRWNGGDWEYIEDHRGQLVFNKKTGEQSTHHELGALPAAVTTTPPIPYSKWSESKNTWVELDNADELRLLDRRAAAGSISRNQFLTGIEIRRGENKEKLLEIVEHELTGVHLIKIRNAITEAVEFNLINDDIWQFFTQTLGMQIDELFEFWEEAKNTY